MKTPSEKLEIPVVGSLDEASRDDHTTAESLHDDLLFIPVGCTSRPPPGPHRNPCDVRCAEDLPKRLYLGSLVTDTFSADDTGWRAHYEDPPPGTAVELEYTTRNQTLCGRFTWNGLDSLSVFADGKNWKAFTRQMALPVPDDWIQLLCRQLRLTSNVRCSFGPKGAPAFSGFPDGPLMSLMFPVPVNRLRALSESLDQIDAESSIKTPIVMTAATARATLEARPTAHTDSDNQDTPAVSTIESELSSAGGWVYLANVTCFFRDLSRVVSCCRRAGLIGTPSPETSVTSYPDGAMWEALVHPETGHSHGYSFATTGEEPATHVGYQEVHPVDPTARLTAANNASRSEVKEKLAAAETFFEGQPDTCRAVDEDSVLEGTMSDVDEDDWALAGEGDLGGTIWWGEEFAPIASVDCNLWLLEEVGENEIDMDNLLKGLDHLEVLHELSFPPLNSGRDFDEIDGFMTFEEEFEGGPGMSFDKIRIYVDRDEQAALLEEFRVLNERLELLGTEKGLI